VFLTARAELPELERQEALLALRLMRAERSADEAHERYLAALWGEHVRDQRRS
jgi:hypothetical protein